MTKKCLDHLSPAALYVTQQSGTEPPFSGKYNDFDEPGTYHCVVCETPLFKSETKFPSGCGWPAFYEALAQAITEHQDLSHGMVRTEIRCCHCDAHLGHKFPDGPYGTRYCINSVALSFKPLDASHKAQLNEPEPHENNHESK